MTIHISTRSIWFAAWLTATAGAIGLGSAVHVATAGGAQAEVVTTALLRLLTAAALLACSAAFASRALGAGAPPANVSLSPRWEQTQGVLGADGQVSPAL